MLVGPELTLLKPKGLVKIRIKAIFNHSTYLVYTSFPLFGTESHEFNFPSNCDDSIWPTVTNSAVKRLL